MDLLDKILRTPLPNEFQALLEKLDVIETTRDDNYWAIEKFCNQAEKFLTRYELFVFRRSLKKLARRDALYNAMCVVMGEQKKDGMALIKKTIDHLESIKLPQPASSATLRDVQTRTRT